MAARRLLGLLWLLVLLFQEVSPNGMNRKIKSYERRLFDYLMTSYDVGSRPVFYANETVKVYFSISLNQVHDLVEKNQTLITHVWIFEEWRDEILQWKPSKFGGLESAVIPATMIWLPDIYIFNNADKGTVGFVASNDSKLVVYFDGRVTWTIPLIIKSSCAVDVKYFPFDNQHCFLRFGSWIYEEGQLDLILKNPEVDLSPPFSKNNELDLISTNLTREVISYETQEGQYPQIVMYLHIRRKAVYYAYTVIAPTLVLCILTLFSFLLPCDNGDKVGIGLTVFLSLYVLQLSIAENIPESNSLPLIGLFLTLVMTLNAISLVFATLVINIKKKGDRMNCPSVPNFVLAVCKKILAKITCTPFFNFYDFYGYCEPVQPTQPITTNMEDDVIPYKKVIGQTRGGMATLRPNPRQDIKRHNVKVTVKEKYGETCSSTLDEGESRDRPSPPRDPRYEWYFVAEVLDKSLFLVFLVAMVFTIAMSLVIIPWLHRND